MYSITIASQTIIPVLNNLCHSAVVTLTRNSPALGHVTLENLEMPSSWQPLSPCLTNPLPVRHSGGAVQRAPHRHRDQADPRHGARVREGVGWAGVQVRIMMMKSWWWWQYGDNDNTDNHNNAYVLCSVAYAKMCSSLASKRVPIKDTEALLDFRTLLLKRWAIC